MVNSATVLFLLDNTSRIFFLLIVFPTLFQRVCFGMTAKEHLAAHLKFTHMYSFQSQSQCPPFSNTYVVGARIRLSDYRKESMLVVTALEVICSDNIRTKVKGETMVFDKNIGDWTEMMECPNGLFVTEIRVHMKDMKNDHLISPIDGFEVKKRENGRVTFNVRSNLRTKFIAGFTFNCSYDDHYPLVPSSSYQDGKDSFTLGNLTDHALKINCIWDKAIIGIYLANEAMITLNYGERMVPVKMTIMCLTVLNPAANCRLQLDWKKLGPETLDCGENNIVGTGTNNVETLLVRAPESFTCKVRHFTGSTLNANITNLHTITDSYKPANMNSSIGALLIPKLLNPFFLKDWVNLYKLPITDYFKYVKKNIFKYLTFHKNEISEVKFRNVKQFKTPQFSEGDSKIQHGLDVSQLVAYCNVYKIYFPIFKTEFQNVIHTKIDEIDREILFERDPNKFGLGK